MCAGDDLGAKFWKNAQPIVGVDCAAGGREGMSCYGKSLFASVIHEEAPGFFSCKKNGMKLENLRRLRRARWNLAGSEHMGGSGVKQGKEDVVGTQDQALMLRERR